LEASDGGRPFLGICLGMQVLVDTGEESGGCEGLAVIPGSCKRLIRPGLKVPHMGWNALDFQQQDCPLFEGLAANPHVYFVHSYAVEPSDRDVISATVDYGGEVVAALRKGNLYATQFHPEKSQEAGLKMLGNFGRLLAATAAS
jgi:imidazole glycerol-phosphate synthase subunit HisH